MEDRSLPVRRSTFHRFDQVFLRTALQHPRGDPTGTTVCLGRVGCPAKVYSFRLELIALGFRSKLGRRTAPGYLVSIVCLLVSIREAYKDCDWENGYEDGEQ